MDDGRYGTELTVNETGMAPFTFGPMSLRALSPSLDTRFNMDLVGGVCNDEDSAWPCLDATHPDTSRTSATFEYPSVSGLAYGVCACRDATHSVVSSVPATLECPSVNGLTFNGTELCLVMLSTVSVVACVLVPV